VRRSQCVLDHRGELTPTAATLRALHRAHVDAIPFENLDVLLRRPVRLDVESLQDKLVRRPRGGYCYVHNLLFGALLERLGFRVRRLAGRVWMRPADRAESSGPGNDAAPPRSPAVLRVEAGDTSWLADVGFGGEGLLEPIRFADGATSRQGGWTFRLDHSGGEWVLRSLHPEGWFDRYSVDLVV